MKKEKQKRKYKHSDFKPNLYVVLTWALLPLALLILLGIIYLCFELTTY